MSDELLETVWRNLFFFLWLCSLMTAGVYAIGPNLGAAGGGGALEKMEIEVQAFRLQQFEAYGKNYGSKAWKILYEAVGISESALRKCMILIWRDLIGLDMDAKFSAVVGAVLVVIPKNLDSLTGFDREAFLAIEQQLASFHTDLTIYFARESAELQSLLSSVALTSGRATTAMQQLLNSMIADNYQISSTNTATTNVATAKVYNIIAQLNAAERGKPYLFIVAHYDTYGIIPAMATGADSNGSGMAVLLELLAIFSQLYAQSQRAHYNLVFALTAGGQFNYQGSRSFIDDFNERYSEETVSLAICLDGLAKGDHLYVHAAKMPSIGSSASNFFEILNDFGTGANGSRPQIEMITKKINLAADRMAWEHEIYNIRRIHALTLSHFKNYSDPERNTLLDTVNSLSMATLETNAKTIADAMISFVFNINSQHCKNALDGTKAECTVLNEAINVDRQRLGAWMNMFATKPRPIVVPQQQLISNLHEVAKRYAHSVQIAEVSVNDFVLYDVIEDTLTANIVKPSIFELLLASTICAYLYAIYYFAMNAQCLLECSLTKIRKLL